MSHLLFRLGTFSYRRRGIVALAWLLLFAAIAAAAAVFSGPQSTSFTVPGTESQRALDALRRDLPQAAAASGSVALRTPDGLTFTDTQVRKDVEDIAAAARRLPGVAAVQSPFDSGLVSKDGRTAILGVQYDKPNQDLPTSARDGYLALADIKSNSGLIVAPGGEPASGPAQVGAREGIGVIVALVVLIITLGSLVAAGMTLLNAFVGVAVGLLALTALSGVVDLNSTAPILALMLGLAVGIDYALFITARFRTLLGEGVPAQLAAGRAIATAGSAVVFAGLTVVIALAALAVVGIPFIGVMGLAAAGTVALAVLVSLTLLPAVLAYAGQRVLPRRTRRNSAPASGSGQGSDVRRTFGRRWAEAVVRRRVPVLITGLAMLVVLALPILDIRLALADNGSAPASTSKRQAYDLISQGFGPGYNARLLLVGQADTAERTAALTDQAAQRVSRLADVVRVAPAASSPSGTTRAVLVLPAEGPSTESTQKLVVAIRAAVNDLPSAGESLDLTGLTAVGADVSDRLGAALPRYLIIVVGLSLLLLLVAFRSVLVPLKATVGFLLSLGAAFGITVAVFQWGWLASLIGTQANGAIDSLLPILLVGILFGLAMDYEVFLVSRMREEHLSGADPNAATVRGVEHGARVVTAAALIMTSVFAGFVFIDDPSLKIIGFALAVGVFIDAFIVRLTLVPALMSLLGNKAWWLPHWLEPIVPRMDVEGGAITAEA